MKLKDFGLKPLEHVALPETGEDVIAMIHSRSFVFISETKEVIDKHECYVLLYGELDKEDGEYHFDEDGGGYPYEIPPCGYYFDVGEENGSVSLCYGGKDERETTHVYEDAVVSYYKIVVEPVVTKCGNTEDVTVIDWIKEQE